MGRLQVTAKRAIDIIASVLALVVLSPLLLFICMAVRLNSPGPMLYRQRRLGKGGKPFILLKIRSMFIDAPDLRNPDGSTFSAKDDPRVTPLGRLLRRTSLDELPQLINVLKGEMSLIGPRPDQVDQIQYYTFEEELKLTVRPGLTGLAQINGRNNITWQERKRLDLLYVEQQSLRLDLRILLQTIPYVIGRRDVFAGKNLETTQ